MMLSKRLSRICLYIVALLLAVALSATLFGVLPQSWHWALRAALAVGAVALMSWAAVKALPSLDKLTLPLPAWWTRYGALALFAISLIARLLMLALVPTEPASDYLLYYERAKALALGEAAPWDAFIVVIAPNVWGYVTALAGWMRVLGATVVSAQVFVALCFSGMVAAFYGAARRIVPPKAAAVAALWVALSPQTLLYTLNLGNEALAMLLMMLGFLCLIEIPSKKPIAAAMLAVGAGLALALCEAVRPIAAIVLLPLGVRALLSPKGGKARQILWFALALAVFLAADALLGMLRAQAFGVSLPSSLGWTLYEGLDLAAHGKWTAEKSAVMLDLLNTLPAAEVQPRLLSMAWERVSAYGVLDWLRLFAYKLSSLWGDCGYLFTSPPGQHVAALAIATASLWAQQLLLIANAIRTRKRDCAKCALGLAPVLLLTLFCMVGTSVSRYHFVAIPFVALALAGMGSGQASTQV